MTVISMATAAALLRAPDTQACCPAYAGDMPISIADQEILVVWDAERHVEHFIRRAAFEGTPVRDFGFLVPTPSKPTLSEAPNAVFDSLQEATRPKHETRWEIDWTPLLLLPFARLSKSDAAAAATADSPVRILDRQNVAGYEAVVLEADDAGVLTRWLGDHGYDARPEIEEWVKPYIVSHWKITAFKYAAPAAPDRGAHAVGTSSVRLSFPTDRPLFPYRVPTDQVQKPHEGHLLRVFFVGDGRFDGALGSHAAPWAGQLRYANHVDGLGALLAGAAPPEALAKARWVTVFDDPTWPSGRDDLFFAPARDASPVVPVIADPKKIPAPLDVLAAAVGAGFWIRRRRPSRA
jgi:hypothetical protein